MASMGFQAIAIGCLFIGQVECTAGAELAANVAGYVGTVADGINMGLKSGSSRPNSQGNRVTTIFDGIGLVNAATGSTKAEKTGIRAADEMMAKGLGVARAAPGFAFGIAQLAQVGGVIQDFQRYAH